MSVIGLLVLSGCTPARKPAIAAELTYARYAIVISTAIIMVAPFIFLFNLFFVSLVTYVFAILSCSPCFSLSHKIIRYPMPNNNADKNFEKKRMMDVFSDILFPCSSTTLHCTKYFPSVHPYLDVIKPSYNYVVIVNTKKLIAINPHNDTGKKISILDRIIEINRIITQSTIFATNRNPKPMRSVPMFTCLSYVSHLKTLWNYNFPLLIMPVA